MGENRRSPFMRCTLGRTRFARGRHREHPLGDRGHRREERPMPELLVDFITTLDGYGAGEGWPGWWGLQGPEYMAWLEAQPEAAYTILMGANTYRVMSGFAAEGEPGTEPLAGMSKIVFSKTLTEPLQWANT